MLFGMTVAAKDAIESTNAAKTKCVTTTPKSPEALLGVISKFLLVKLIDFELQRALFTRASGRAALRETQMRNLRGPQRNNLRRISPTNTNSPEPSTATVLGSGTRLTFPGARKISFPSPNGTVSARTMERA